MLRNFFKTTIRTLLKNKTYSFLNIMGLAIGIACTGLIFLWVEDEVTFDNVNLKKDRIYMALNNWPFSEHFSTFESTPIPMGPAMMAEIPGIANVTRYSEGSTSLLFKIGEKSVYASGSYADSSIFSIFTLPFVQGNAHDAFKQPYSIVLTEKTAKKFFGATKNVVGKALKVDNKDNFIVTGVVKDLPENATLQFEWLSSLEDALKQDPGVSQWDNNNIITFAELKKNANLANINKQLHGFIKKREPGTIVSTFLFPMADWHLRFAFENGKQTGGGRIQYVHMFTIIAWIILFLACINFMNLATARSEKRSKEVGVRKVLGSGKKRLVLQFIGEAMFMSLLAVIASTLIMSLALPAFNLLTQKNLSLNIGNPLHLAALAVITVICGLVAGSYPSLYLSSFNPVFVLKGMKLKNGSAGLIRRGLVVTQFTVSIVLIISTVIIYQQIQHAKNRELGYNKNNLLEIGLKGDMGKNFTAIKQDLLNSGVAENAALADHELVYSGNNSIGYTWKGKSPTSKPLISQRHISPEMLSTAGIKIVQGRDFNPNPAADSNSIIITESLAKMMNIPTVLGQTIQRGDDVYKIAGVAKDMIYGDIYRTSDPVIFFCEQHNEYESMMYIRLKATVPTEEAVAKVEAVIKKDNPAYPFDYRFTDDVFNRLFTSEALVSKLSRVFAALAIIICCLGLFGLAAYTAERRTKEIGIRKVLGASVTGLASMLSLEFLKLVLLSVWLAFPLAWYAMHTWLQNYPYRVNMQWWVFAAAGTAAMLIAIITISFQAVKAALMNPVKAIKTE
ncbi:MAG TPA: ABC transporter permease [Chitinophagaceae bacterium]|jgi:predicted permease|nr:ABC transporter permease [Chitinophagaceae bacterium]